MFAEAFSRVAEARILHNLRYKCMSKNRKANFLGKNLWERSERILAPCFAHMLSASTDWEVSVRIGVHLLPWRQGGAKPPDEV